MTTPLDLITTALRDSGVIGVGQTASAEDNNDAFNKMNRMLAIWNRRRWLVFHLLDIAFTSTGANSYTIGAGANYNTPRVDRIESAFIRQPITGGLPVDYPLTIIDAREDYNRIALKTLSSLPESVFLDSGYPTGTVYFYPVPPASIYEMHLTVKAQLTAFATLTQDINLPPEYEEALIYNLAVRLRPAYQMPPDPSVSALAAAALSTIKTANSQVANLQMPSALRGLGYSTFNIYRGY